MIDDLPREILQARVKLMLSEPYLASAIARFPVVNAKDMDWCNTMATDGYYIYVSPEFCAELKVDEIAFVFAHEIMHCVLGHIDRRGSRDPDLWNQAIDYATNLLLVELGLTMPKVGLFERKYRGMTAEDIYRRLQDAGQRRSGQKRPKKSAEDSTLASGDSKREADKKVQKRANGASAPSGWDLHIDPCDPRGQAARAKEFPTSEERRRLRITLTKAMAPKLRGIAPGLFEQEIRQARGGDIPWRTLISRFFSGLRRDDYRMFPANKKHLWRGLYLPSMGAPGPTHIVVAVDTSGSMSDDDLGMILGELDKLRSVTQCNLTLIQCDAEIHKIDEFDECSEIRFDRYSFAGRGGTAFEPVFDWIRDQSQRGVFHFDALIYLTDGFGSFPPKPPPYPVLWIMTEHCLPDVPFGEVIRMSGSHLAAA